MHNTDAHIVYFIKIKGVSKYLGDRAQKLSKSLKAIISVNLDIFQRKKF